MNNFENKPKSSCSSASSNPNGKGKSKGNININSNSNNAYFDPNMFTTREKLALCSGADLWNLRAIPTASVQQNKTKPNTKAATQPKTAKATATATTSIRLSDGPHGVRKPLNDLTLQEAHPATCFPSACATACSWNVDLIERMGRALARECEHLDVHVLLGPGVNIKRNPLGGRNHEYFSEDPFLTGTLARAYIAGVQHSGTVAACIKHFCANNQESARMVVDAIVDERTLRELYLPAFEMAICPWNSDGDGDGHKHVPKLVMAAYNKVNGVYCCENKYLLKSILRDEWKFSGVVVSDWGAVNDRVESLKAGMDLEMPGNPGSGCFEREVLESVGAEGRKGGGVRAAIDRSAGRIAGLIAELEVDRNRRVDVDVDLISDADIDIDIDTDTDNHQRHIFEEHDQLARTIARECIVLLQNRENLLPLSRTQNVAVIGDFAGQSPRYQGMGSAHVTPTRVTSVCSAIRSFLSSDARFGRNDLESASSTESDNNDMESIPFARGYDADCEGDEIDQNLIDEAVGMLRQPCVDTDIDVVVLCVGLPEIMESEGFDRSHMRLPKQHIALVEAVTRVHPNVVVVLSNGGIVEIPQSFVDGAKSILDGFLPGQNGGDALVDVLFGAVSPSGKLPETIPIRGERDVPSSKYFSGTKKRVEYREGLDVGYRYFDTANIPVRFPFGHGLQYTNFRYSNLAVDIQRDNETSKRVVVSLDVENIGLATENGSPLLLFSKPAMEVIQLYVRPIRSGVYRPWHELKSFSKIELAPGEKQTARFVLDERSFAYYDVGLWDWVVERSCLFEIQVGASSRDIRLTETIGFETGRTPSRLAIDSYAPVVVPNEEPTGGVPAAPKRFDVGDEEFRERFVTDGGARAAATTPTTTTTGLSKPMGHGGEDEDHPFAERRSKAEPASIICRNTLLSDAARASWIAHLILFFSMKVAASEVKEGATKKRELRMIRANVENLPLRGLVIFSKGHFSFRLLDFLILIMNGHWAAVLTYFFRRKTRSTSRASPADEQ